jgi:predicted Ser/Thr protein kinase
MSQQQKEVLKASIEKLDENEQTQIFKIVRKYTNEYTRTDTGVFVSSDVLPKTCLEEIEQYVRFCHDQRKRMDEESKIRKKYERLVKS